MEDREEPGHCEEKINVIEAKEQGKKKSKLSLPKNKPKVAEEMNDGDDDALSTLRHIK